FHYIQRRQLPVGRAWCSPVRARRGRSFHRARSAAPAVAQLPAQRKAACDLKAKPEKPGKGGQAGGGFRMIVLGLTGSIGMGKSTTAQLFAEAGVPVYDADAAVHRLYESEAAPAIEAAFPGTTAGGKVDRTLLSARVVHDPEAIKRLEAIVHPMLRAHHQEFLDNAERSGAPVAVVDVPLLYETGGEARVDAVVVVTTSPEVQRQRILARDNMTDEKL